MLRTSQRLIAMALALAIGAAACSDAAAPTTLDGAPTSVTTPTGAPAAPSIAPPVRCDGECIVTAVRFAEPRDLDGVRTFADETGTALVALWRVNPVCMPVVGFGPPAADDATEESWFAYASADLLRAAQDANAPPATDGGASVRFRDRFVEEWHAALDPDVRFAGAAYLSLAATLAHPDIAEQGRVEAYLTDGAGVLYIRNHWDGLAAFFGQTSEPC